MIDFTLFRLPSNATARTDPNETCIYNARIDFYFLVDDIYI